MRHYTLAEAAERRILVLDGAMGTMIQRYGLSEADFRGARFRDSQVTLRGDNDLLNITRPDIVDEIHRKYLAAGADIITTNTFNSQRISQADYRLECLSREMALAGARLARSAADAYSTPGWPRFVAGSVGPTNKTCSLSPDVGDPAARDVTFDELASAYAEQMDALAEGGVDAFLVETIFDTINAKAAIVAAMDVMERRGVRLPIMLSVTISDLAGRTLSGQTLDAFLASISTYPVFSVGLNCSFGPAQMKPYLRQLARRAPYYVSAHPNAGLPDAMGHYDETPQSMAQQMAEFVDEGLVNIIGGCCGTSDEYIALYPPLVEGREPRKPAVNVQQSRSSILLSGLDLLEVTPEVRFVNVGERCNVAGSRKFLRLISEKNYAEALGIARKQVADGALVIDVNMDDGLLDARREMVEFLNLLASEPDIARVPVMVDSSNWDVVVAGLKCLQGKGIVNSISLKEGEAVFLSHARDAMRYGAAVVVMCFDEQGQATTYGRRIEIAERAYRLLTESVGMDPRDIIFDPNVLAIATGMEEHDSYAADFIKATAWIRKNLPWAHVSGGVSNLSFAFRGNNFVREAMHAVFLYHAIQAGLDFGIVNPATRVTYDDIPEDMLQIIEDVVLYRRKGASDDLVELAARLREQEANAKATQAGSHAAEPQWRKLPLAERLSEALVKGIGDYLEADLGEAIASFPSAVNIIEGPLMDGMNRVGELFGSGKMFLPQVVKAARTMKQAVKFLNPYIESGRVGKGAPAGKVLLATVKGDVHDIGKNIVSVVMACNGYDVLDLGVMVPAEQIVRKAQEEHPVLIGLSGLITPSLEEMVNVARELDAAGINVPLMIGGATTSNLHVALKIAPVYGGPVVWVKDASQNPIVAAHLLDDAGRASFEASVEAEQAALRRDYQSRQPETLSIDEARERRLNLFDD